MASFDEGIELYQNTPGSVLVDLRDAEDFEKGHIPGAIHGSLGSLREEIRKVATFRTPIFLYCYLGKRSRQAEELLRAKGYAEARSIGGLEGYRGEITTRKMTFRQLREENQLTQTAMAEILSVSPAAIGHYETGRAAPGKETAARIRELYHVEIIPEEREKKKEQKAEKSARKKKVSEAGTALREFRKSLGMSQAAFAESIGVSHATIGHYETGFMSPSEKVIAKIHEIYGSAPGRAVRKRGKPKMILQSPDGREISIPDLMEKIEGAESVYIRPDEGKAYWIREGESGSVELW